LKHFVLPVRSELTGATQFDLLLGQSTRKTKELPIRFPRLSQESRRSPTRLDSLWFTAERSSPWIALRLASNFPKVM
jgi:hypothetical protein